MFASTGLSLWHVRQWTNRRKFREQLLFGMSDVFVLMYIHISQLSSLPVSHVFCFPARCCVYINIFFRVSGHCLSGWSIRSGWSNKSSACHMFGTSGIVEISPRTVVTGVSCASVRAHPRSCVDVDHCWCMPVVGVWCSVFGSRRMSCVSSCRARACLPWMCRHACFLLLFSSSGCSLLRWVNCCVCVLSVLLVPPLRRAPLAPIKEQRVKLIVWYTKLTFSFVRVCDVQHAWHMCALMCIS